VGWTVPAGLQLSKDNPDAFKNAKQDCDRATKELEDRDGVTIIMPDPILAFGDEVPDDLVESYTKQFIDADKIINEYGIWYSKGKITAIH
jgi:hypothetical protein